MNWKDEWKALLIIVAVFLGCYYLPVGTARFDGAIIEAFHLVKWYAQEHVLVCLIPAFFIAGAIGVFVSQASVMKYLGPYAKFNGFCGAMLAYLREDVPKNWTSYRDAVTDNFRVKSPKDFRVLA